MGCMDPKSLKVGNKSIPKTSSFKHLGFVIHDSESMDDKMQSRKSTTYPVKLKRLGVIVHYLTGVVIWRRKVASPR